MSWTKHWSFSGTCKGYYRILELLFNYGNDYRTINLHRPTISVFHEYIDGFPTEKHPMICPLVSGVFNLRTTNQDICLYRMLSKF